MPMRYRDALRSWQASWHRWWRDTHDHAADEAFEDVVRYLHDAPAAPSVVEPLLKVIGEERRKANRHTDSLHKLLDRQHDGQVG